jgi:hypothetical protein
MAISPKLPRLGCREHVCDALRRRGLGALAAADINGDGWLDERDMRNAVESPVRPAAAPTASEFDVSW